MAKEYALKNTNKIRLLTKELIYELSTNNSFNSAARKLGCNACLLKRKVMEEYPEVLTKFQDNSALRQKHVNRRKNINYDTRTIVKGTNL